MVRRQGQAPRPGNQVNPWSPWPDKAEIHLLFSAWSALAPSLGWRVPTPLSRWLSSSLKRSLALPGKHFLPGTLKAPCASFWKSPKWASEMPAPCPIPKWKQNSKLLYGCPPERNVFKDALLKQKHPWAMQTLWIIWGPRGKITLFSTLASTVQFASFPFWTLFLPCRKGL